jgi:3-deoxy-D-manno-octulosonate 8-phosphate phosphatase (KDO 8-P phosphatase)
MLTDARLMQQAASIRLLVLDVDGVLTDGRLLYDGQGGESKAFHVRDGYGMKQLMAHGCDIAVISGRRSAAVERRLQELGVQHAVLGQEDKLPALHEIARQLQIEDFSAIACMGDDVPDLALMAAVGLAFAPADAHPAVTAQVHWQSPSDGGRGAVRELCDLLIRARTETGS